MTVTVAGVTVDPDEVSKADLLSIMQRQDDRIDHLEEAVREERQARKEVEEELAQHKDHTGRELADVRSRVTDVEETMEGERDPSSEPEPGAGGGKTPLERISTTPEHQVDQLGLTANQERARFIARDVRDYAEKAPAGLVIRSSDVKKVIAAKEGNRPHNQTVARVMDFLDTLGKDDVELVKRRGRNLIVVDPDGADRLMACNDRCDGGNGLTPAGTVTSGG